MMRVYSDIEGHEKSRSDPITYLLNHLQYVFKKRKISEDDQANINTLLGALDKQATNTLIKECRFREPLQLYSEIMECEEGVRNKGWKRKVTGHEMITETKPWFAAGTLYLKLAKKYYKGNAYKLRIVNNVGDYWEHNNPTRMIHADIYDQEPKGLSNNDLYRWTEGWEYDIDPLDHVNFKSFMRKRVSEKIKYLPEVLKITLKENAKKDAERRRVQEAKRRQEEKERHEQKITKKYIPLESNSSVSVCYIIREKEPVFTTEKNKCNILYIGETGNWISRQKVYANLKNPKNELILKLSKKFPKLTKEHIIERLKNKVVVLRWILDRGSYEDRLHLEGYLIQRMKPLLNKANSKNREYWNHVTSYKVKKIKGYDIRKGFRVEHENINGTS